MMANTLEAFSARELEESRRRVGFSDSAKQKGSALGDKFVLFCLLKHGVGKTAAGYGPSVKRMSGFDGPTTLSLSALPQGGNVHKEPLKPPAS
jgi:hypothetical protein